MFSQVSYDQTDFRYELFGSCWMGTIIVDANFIGFSGFYGHLKMHYRIFFKPEAITVKVLLRSR